MTPAVRRRVWWAVGGLALLLRVSAAVVTGGLTHPELNEYNSMARAMLDGRGFIFGHLGIIYFSYAPPLHSWLTVASYALAKSIAPVMMLQLVAGSVIAVAAASITERLYDGWLAPLAAGALVAVNPGLIVYSATKAHPLTFDALFFTLALLQTLRLAERRDLRRAVQLGAIVGVGALSRGTTVIFLPIAGVWLAAMTERRAWPSVVRHVVIAGLCASAIVAPWSVRNSLLHHQFVWLLTTDSEDFWRGNNIYATGHSYIDADHVVLNALPPEERADLEGQPNEIAQGRWFMDRAIAFIRAHPGSFVRLTALKFFHFWWFAPQTGVRYPAGWLAAYAAYYVSALGLAAIGLVLVLKRGRSFAGRAVLILLFLLGLSGLQSLYYVEGRHRWAVEPLLLAFSGGGAAFLVRRFSENGDGRDAA